MADRIRLCISPFTTRNQEIKTLEKPDQVIKQASRDESSDQASISMVRILDRRRSWKYRAHSSDYPLSSSYPGLACLYYVRIAVTTISFFRFLFPFPFPPFTVARSSRSSGYHEY